MFNNSELLWVAKLLLAQPQASEGDESDNSNESVKIHMNHSSKMLRIPLHKLTKLFLTTSVNTFKLMVEKQLLKIIRPLSYEWIIKVTIYINSKSHKKDKKVSKSTEKKIVKHRK